MDSDVSGIFIFFKVREGIRTRFIRAVATDAGIKIDLIGTCHQPSGISLLGIDGQGVTICHADSHTAVIPCSIKRCAVAKDKVDIAFYLHSGIHIHIFRHHIPARIHGDGGICDDSGVGIFR